MSTGKRLAKRSILGTRIVAPGHDGRFYPAVIQAVKTYEDRLSENRYTVRFDNSRKVSEFLETDLIGPGFSCVNNLSCLLPGQRVYLTHLGREMEATIMTHDRENDQVVVNLAVGRFQIQLSLEGFPPSCFKDSLSPLLRSRHYCLKSAELTQLCDC